MDYHLHYLVGLFYMLTAVDCLPAQPAPAAISPDDLTYMMSPFAGPVARAEPEPGLFCGSPPDPLPVFVGPRDQVHIDAFYVRQHNYLTSLNLPTTGAKEDSSTPEFAQSSEAPSASPRSPRTPRKQQRKTSSSSSLKQPQRRERSVISTATSPPASSSPLSSSSPSTSDQPLASPPVDAASPTTPATSTLSTTYTLRPPRSKRKLDYDFDYSTASSAASRSSSKTRANSLTATRRLKLDASADAITS